MMKKDVENMYIQAKKKGQITDAEKIEKSEFVAMIKNQIKEKKK